MELGCLPRVGQVSGGECIRTNFESEMRLRVCENSVCLVRECRKHTGCDGAYTAKKNQVFVYPMKTMLVPCSLYPQHCCSSGTQVI